jgi:hypothetical protein
MWLAPMLRPNHAPEAALSCVRVEWWTLPNGRPALKTEMNIRAARECFFGAMHGGVKLEQWVLAAPFVSTSVSLCPLSYPVC